MGNEGLGEWTVECKDRSHMLMFGARHVNIMQQNVDHPTKLSVLLDTQKNIRLATIIIKQTSYTIFIFGASS